MIELGPWFRLFIKTLIIPIHSYHILQEKGLHLFATDLHRGSDITPTKRYQFHFWGNESPASDGPPSKIRHTYFFTNDHSVYCGVGVAANSHTVLEYCSRRHHIHLRW